MLGAQNKVAHTHGGWVWVWGGEPLQIIFTIAWNCILSTPKIILYQSNTFWDERKRFINAAFILVRLSSVHRTFDVATGLIGCDGGTPFPLSPPPTNTQFNFQVSIKVD